MKVNSLLPCANNECNKYDSTATTCCSRACSNKVSSNIAQIINIEKGERKLAEFYANNPQPKCKNPSCDNLCHKVARYWKWSQYCSKDCKDQASSMFKVKQTDDQKISTTSKRKQTIMTKYGVEHTSHLTEVKEKSKKTMMERYGVEYSGQSSEIQEKRVQTNIERYGVIHPSQSPQVMQKQKDTMMERYGAEHALQVPYIQAKLKHTNLDRYGVEFSGGLPEFKEKGRATMMERYGVEHTAQLPDVIAKRHQTLIDMYGGPATNYANFTEIGKEIMKDENFHLLLEMNKEMSMTEIALTHGMSLGSIQQRFSKHGVKPKIHYTSIFHKEVFEFIKTLGINEVVSNRRDIIAPHEIDICINNRLLIECNGLFWHSERCIQDRNYHLNKTIKCEQLNLRLLHLWQHDWNNTREICKSIISSNLNIYQRVVYGRNTAIVKVNKEVESDFLFNNHIQGYVHSVACYGLMIDNELVSIMSFGTPRFNGNYQWELLRFCNKLHTKVIGGASKLFKAFILEYAPQSIISNCHRHLFSGDIYSILGFTFSHYSKPSYYYTNDYRIMFNRMKFQKHKLPSLLQTFDPNQTEWENMMNNGWDRIWDCGNSIWIWK